MIYKIERIAVNKRSLDFLIKILSLKAWIDEGMKWNPADITILPVAVIEYWTPGLNI